MWPIIALSLFFLCRNFCAENFVIFFYEIKLLFTCLKTYDSLFIDIQCTRKLMSGANRRITFPFFQTSFKHAWGTPARPILWSIKRFPLDTTLIRQCSAEKPAFLQFLQSRLDLAVLCHSVATPVVCNGSQRPDIGS